jgi:H+/gluconate symporter-like permease
MQEKHWAFLSAFFGGLAWHFASPVVSPYAVEFLNRLLPADYQLDSGHVYYAGFVVAVPIGVAGARLLGKLISAGVTYAWDKYQERRAEMAKRELDSKPSLPRARPQAAD